MRLFRAQRCVIALLVVTFFVCMLLGIYVVTREDTNEEMSQDVPMWLDTRLQQDTNRFGLGGSQLLQKLKPRAGSDEVNELLQDDNRIKLQNEERNNAERNVRNEKNEKEKLQQEKVEFVGDQSENEVKFKNSVLDEINQHLEYPEPNYNVHVFYYVWYGNPKVDKEYIHWDHKRLPHWDKKIAKKYSTDYHNPPDDIGSNFYPELGPYSSRDPNVIDDHMQQIRSTGAGVLAVSWYPPGLADDNGKAWDDLMPTIMDFAHKYQLKVCFHIEPFTGRSADTIKQWITYIIDTYASHPAFYKFTWKGKELPLYYLYDSYQVGNEEWQKLFTNEGSHSVRNTPLDGYFIGLLVERVHQDQLHASGFDGYYTYFASDGFSYGATTVNWLTIAKKAALQKRIFIPSVGPGYVDDRVRPWNKPNTKDRQHGRYYEQAFDAALGCSAPLVSITSFNEWHEGTQIEKAVPKEILGYAYLDYKPNSSDFYLKLTSEWVQKLSHNQRRFL